MNNTFESNIEKLTQAFYESPEFSGKWANYLPIYSDLFGKFANSDITFIEVGVLHGGSLFMWRKFLGEKARIIGIDLNPEALKWKKHGFEIYIGDQAKSDFWKETLNKIGPFDVLLDDGGHTNLQQIQTMRNVLNHINDGGILVIEDTQTSYQKDFGNPSKGSTINFAKSFVDLIAKRNPELGANEPLISQRIHSIQFFESIFAIHINSKKARKNELITNGKVLGAASDFRYTNGGIAEKIIRKYIRKYGFRFSKLLLRPFNSLLSAIQMSLYFCLRIMLAFESRRIAKIK